MERNTEIPDRLRLVFERMNLSPEEQRRRWAATIDRQNERHAADEDYRDWLAANKLNDERYSTQLAAASYGMEYADLGIEAGQAEALAYLTLEVIKRFNVFPWKVIDRTLYVAVADYIWPAEDIQSAAGVKVKAVLASRQAIQYRIAKHFAA